MGTMDSTTVTILHSLKSCVVICCACTLRLPKTKTRRAKNTFFMVRISFGLTYVVVAEKLGVFLRQARERGPIYFFFALK